MNNLFDKNLDLSKKVTGDNPVYIMMVGLPTSGKSTFVNKLLSYPCWEKGIVLSTDNYIDEIATKSGITHDEAFRISIRDATKHLNECFTRAIEQKLPIIHDQTNLTIKTRSKKLKRIPKSYFKIAIYSQITFDEALKRNCNRPGKVIPSDILTQMLGYYQIPTESEGFDMIMNINDPFSTLLTVWEP